MKKQKLELTWIGKENRPKLEPRILLENPAKSYHAKHRVPSRCHYWQESTLLQQVLEMAHDMERRELFLRQDEMQTKRDNLVDRPVLQLQHQVGLITVFVGTSFNPKMKEKKYVH